MKKPKVKVKKRTKVKKPKPPRDFGIYLVSRRSKGIARLVARRKAVATTTFSERYARRFRSEKEAIQWLTQDRLDELAGFTPLVTKLAPRLANRGGPDPR